MRCCDDRLNPPNTLRARIAPRSKRTAWASMSGTGNCYDNAVAESFFATLELELIMKNDWATREAARRAIFRYIETWYNRQRRHSTLGYVSPAEHEAQLREAA